MLPLLAASSFVVPLCTWWPGPQDGEEPRRSWYDVRDIVESSRVDPYAVVDLRPHLASLLLEDLEPSGSPQLDELRVSLDAIDVSDVVLRSLHVAEGVEVESTAVHAGRLVVVGNAEAHAVVGRTLDVLRRATAEGVRVDVHRLRTGQVAGGAWSCLGAEAAAECLAGLPGTLVARERVRLGLPATLGDTEWSTVLYDYDVEVGQFVVGADPAVSIVHSGLEVAVRVDRAADGRRFVVRTWGRDGGLDGEPRTLRLESLGDAPVELPRVKTSLWTASGIVEPGGALVVEHGGGEYGALIVRVAADGRVPATTGDIVPLGELHLAPMRLPFPVLSRVAPSGGWDPEWNMSPLGPASWDHEPYASSLATESIPDGLEGGGALFLDSRLLLFDPGLATDGLRADLDGVRADLGVSTIGVDVRYDYVESAQAAEVLADGGAAGFAQRARHRLLGSVLEGDTLVLMGGRESAYLRDHNVQLAQAAVIADPLIDIFFEGLALWCAPILTPEGRVASWFEVQAQESDAAIRGVATSMFVRAEKEGETGLPPEGRFEERLWIELPVAYRATARTRVIMDPDSWTLVAARRMAGTERTLVVVARMMAQR